MRITTAMLADAAHLTAGKLYILGGGFDALGAKAFPTVYRTLTVVLIAEVGPSDRNRDLEILVELLDEDGNEIGVKAQGKMRVGTPSLLPAGATSAVPLVMPFQNVAIRQAGGYVFLVRLGEEELARIPFRVIQRPPS